MEKVKSATDSQFEDRTFYGVAETVSTWAGIQKAALENVPFRITTLSGDHVTGSPRFHYYVENLHKLEVEKGPWMRQAPIPGADTVYVYASDKHDPRLEDVVTGIIKKDKAKYPDIRKNIIKADEKLWARRMRM